MLYREYVPEQIKPQLDATSALSIQRISNARSELDAQLEGRSADTQVTSAVPSRSYGRTSRQASLIGHHDMRSYMNPSKEADRLSLFPIKLLLDATQQLNALQDDGWTVGKSAVDLDLSEAEEVKPQEGETPYAFWAHRRTGTGVEVYTQMGTRSGFYALQQPHFLYHTMAYRHLDLEGSGAELVYATASVGQQSKLYGGLNITRDQYGRYYDRVERKSHTMVTDVACTGRGVVRREEPRTGDDSKRTSGNDKPGGTSSARGWKALWPR